MITIVANGRKHHAPVGWHEVTVATAQQIAQWNGQDKIELFNILTGTEYDAVKTSTDLGSVFWDVINFVYFPAPVANAKVPRRIAFDKGHIVDIPKNVGKLSIGQLISVRQRMEEVQARIEKAVKDDPDYTKYFFTKDFLFDEMIGYTCAVCLQPMYDKAPFDTERAANVEAFINEMPITDMYPLGFFFLSQQWNFGKRQIKPSLLMTVLQMLKRPRSRKWLRLIY